MSHVWDGKHYWTWVISSVLNGDTSAIANKLKSLGFVGIIVKAHDGANIWPQFKNTLQAFKSAGLKVGAWGYCYGNDVTGEANAALDAIKAGADWYIADVEIEYEGKADQAKQFGQLLRSGAGSDYQIAYTSFAFPTYHPKFPYAEFSSFCNVTLPQVYWMELAPDVTDCLKQSFDQYKQFNLPFAPIGQTYVSEYNNTKWTPTDEDYVNFEATCKALNVTGVSFWDMQHASDAMFTAVGRMNFTMPVPIEPVSQKVEVADWAKASVDKVQKAGVMHGDETGFRPTDAVSREELAVILDRLGLLDEVLKIKGMS